MHVIHILTSYIYTQKNICINTINFVTLNIVTQIKITM